MQASLDAEPMTALAEIGRVPIAFEVDRVLDVVVHDGGLGGMTLVERRLDAPYVKDYDAIRGEGPTRWARRFDLSNWQLIVARSDARCVGAAVVAWNTEGVTMLEGRSDLAVLWDLRVAPELRGTGLGSALFGRAAVWAAGRGCRQLKIETQNINVPACRFYVRQGCTLGAIHRFAYPELPEEVQLLWYRDLPAA